MSQETEALDKLLKQEEDALLKGWMGEAGSRNATQEEVNSLFHAFRSALAAGANPDDFDAPAWRPLRDALSQLSRSRAAQGQTAGDTSVFVLAFKRPIFSALQRRLEAEPKLLVSTLWMLSVLVDKMAQATVNTYQESREEIIWRQQEELLELSTPVIKLWEGVLAVPMIGTLDSSRTQIVMETLLQDRKSVV